MNADIENVKRTQCASHTSKLNKKCDKLQLTWSLNQCLFYNSWNFGGNEVYGGGGDIGKGVWTLESAVNSPNGLYWAGRGRGNFLIWAPGKFSSNCLE